MAEDARDDPRAELERDERERLLFIKLEARWPMRVLKALVVVSSVVGAVWLACTLLLGFDYPGRSALSWCSRALVLAIITWLPMLVMSFAWSAQARRNKAICYALAIGLFAVVALGIPWLLHNAL